MLAGEVDYMRRMLGNTLLPTDLWDSYMVGACWELPQNTLGMRTLPSGRCTYAGGGRAL
jgi:hypothetical protein